MEADENTRSTRTEPFLFLVSDLFPEVQPFRHSRHSSSFVVTPTPHRGYGVVHAVVLVILPDDFHQPRLVFREQREILH